MRRFRKTVILCIICVFDLTEVLRQTERDLKKTQRGVDRDRAKLERDEKKLVSHLFPSLMVDVPFSRVIMLGWTVVLIGVVPMYA